ncbi:GTPase HflX [uncultured Victivallis sp.]|uniref:GTPase HflX n=1 Tax=uncultured Victivallis sp. TaxID=354118 RepID=UPI0025DF41EB|nr:GTPase HflX [uncultured Victivallis sp.]
MIEIAEDSRKKVERALLVGFRFPDQSEAEVNEHLDELADLVRNLDIVPLEPEIVNLHLPSPRYYIGSGKAGEIARLMQECEADCLIFDTPLSPSQQRNWERLTHSCVIDREEVILDIFAERASTREAVLQVELARTKYSLPRLTRAWTHLSRQHGGGATTRGEGEAQIETDRRLLRRRIRQLEEELQVVRKQRETQRKSRQRNLIPHGAIVGYTNVGKSSLLRKLSGAEILVKDQLFATLDPTTRRVPLENGLEVLLTDTVGFVRKLPHSLVEAFKSTLEEAVLADFLLLVLDVSSSQLDAQWETTLSVLKELGAQEKKIVIVFNKVDLVDRETDPVLFARLRGLFPDALYLSTRTGEGIDALKERLCAIAAEEFQLMRVKLPPQRHDLAALAHANGRVYEENYNDSGELELVFTIGPALRHKFREYAL